MSNSLDTILNKRKNKRKNKRNNPQGTNYYKLSPITKESKIITARQAKQQDVSS